MTDSLLNKRDDNLKIAEKYIEKYTYDLQNHMELSDTQLVKLLNSCIAKIKRKNTEKRWWQFF